VAALVAAAGAATLATSRPGRADTDNLPVVYFPEDTYSVNEAAGTLTVEVRLSEESDQEVTVQWSSAGVEPTPAGTADFSPSAGQVTFAPGETSRTIVLTIEDDDIAEESESAELTLYDPVNAQLDSRNVTTVTVTDNDEEPPSVTVEFESSSVEATEGDGTVGVVVKLSATNPYDVTVSYTVAPGTAETQDYSAPSSGSLTIPAGTSQGTIDVEVIDDTEGEEGPETVDLKLTGAVNASLGTQTECTLTINDNDGEGGDDPTIVIERDGEWADKVLEIRRPSPNNTIKFKATIRNGAGTEKIRFVLVDTSKEPGTNLNTGEGEAFDLTFEAQDGFEIVADTDKQQIKKTAAAAMASVKVTAHDYGAFGKIKAVIDGTAIESDAIRVLRDADANNIEDAWDNAFPAAAPITAAADDDRDDILAHPNIRQAPTRGDSLSRYEEYRGFTIDGAYKTTNPLKIDVFYHDADGIGQTGDFTAAKLFITPHAVRADEYKTVDATGGKWTKINFNRKTSTVGQQGIIRVKIDNTISTLGRATSLINRPDINTDDVPASNIKTVLNIDWFSRSISTSEAVNATTRVIPTTAGTTAWQVGGRIKVEDEEMGIVEHNTTAANTTLAAPLKGDTQDVVIVNANAWITTGWATVGAGANIEHITWTSLRAADKSTRLTAALPANADARTLTVTSNTGFRSGTNMYLYIGEEIMRVTGFGSNDTTLEVERARFGTTLAAHAVDANVYQKTMLIGVQRAQGGTEKKNHAPGAAVERKRAFLVTARAGGAAHESGKTINYFYSNAQRDAAIKSTFAHECGHSCFFGHADVSPCIMKSTIAAGATDGVGLYHDFSLFNLRQIRVKN
jgi:hypothetical protein